MKFSTRSTYGLRAMVVLACRHADGPVFLRDIAEIQQLPITYLEQLMVPLRKSGMVSAMRGINGGYRLTRPPQEITLAEVIEILEGPLDLIECSSVANCSRHPQQCALREVLDQASHTLVTYLQSVTLADLCARQHALDDLATAAPATA